MTGFIGEKVHCNFTDEIVLAIEVIQNPLNKEEWGLTFIYDGEGYEGDVIDVGFEEEMLRTQALMQPAIGLSYAKTLEYLNNINRGEI